MHIKREYGNKNWIIMGINCIHVHSDEYVSTFETGLTGICLMFCHDFSVTQQH